MLWINSISAAIYTIINSDATIINSNFTVGIEPILNTDENLAPWVGIYHAGTSIEPKRANNFFPWEITTGFEIMVQGADILNRDNSVDQAQRAVTAVLTAINCSANRDLMATVDNYHLTTVTERARMEEEDEAITTFVIGLEGIIINDLGA